MRATLFLTAFLPLVSFEQACSSRSPESGDTRASEFAAWEPCADPAPILDPKGASTGWVRCADGSVNRIEAVPVDTSLYSVHECELDKDPECTSDTDCVAHPNGHCAQWYSSMTARCGCTYLCSADSECAAGEVCVSPEVPHGGTWPVCHSAVCLTGADCSSGECGYTMCGASYQTATDADLGCRTTEDACRVNDDCSDGNWCGPSNGQWTCGDCEDAG
jgi:hypothetical protein